MAQGGSSGLLKYMPGKRLIAVFHKARNAPRAILPF